MAKEPKSPQLTEAALNQLVASVHTYESFGRAIVAAALAEAKKSAATVAPSKIAATVHVMPMPPHTHFSAGGATAGTAGAAGPASGGPTLSITICVGENCYTMGV